MTLKIAVNYSPNFSTKRRIRKNIKFLLIHYTGMYNEKRAIDKLTSIKSKVSCHYFVKKNGQVILMVPDFYIAWHAGISNWKNLNEEVLSAGGLHVIGTERNESRRMDNQLRGRSGRQGDPGSSRFYISLEDNLMRIFA